MSSSPRQDARTIFFTESSMNIGGQELQAIQQMIGLNSLGYQTVLLCKPRSAIGRQAKKSALSVIEIGFRNAFHFSSIKKALDLLYQFQPIAVLSHGSRDALIFSIANILAGLFSKLKTKIFRVKTFQHGYPLSFSYNYLFSKSFTPSDYLRDKLLANRWINPDQVETLYPGIDFSRLDEPADLPVHVRVWLDDHPGPVISQGAILRGEKGHQIILKALAEVRKVFPDIRYLVAGEGQDRPLLEALIQELDLTQHVLIAGIMEDIAPILRASDIAVLPSLIEPLGMFQIEAQYLKIPTIASSVGGIPETLINHQTGLLVEPGNIEAWSMAIIWMLSNPQMAKDFGDKGRRLVMQKFSKEVNLSRLIENLN